MFRNPFHSNAASLNRLTDFKEYRTKNYRLMYCFVFPPFEHHRQSVWTVGTNHQSTVSFLYTSKTDFENVVPNNHLCRYLLVLIYLKSGLGAVVEAQDGRKGPLRHLMNLGSKYAYYKVCSSFCYCSFYVIVKLEQVK